MHMTRTPESESNHVLILASSSPRRRQLLTEAGVPFEAVDPPIPEPAPSGLSPIEQAESLAYFKARAVRPKYPDRTILAADTIVALNGQVMGKASDEAQALNMLQMLSGTRHQVITGMAIIEPGRRQIAYDVTYVTMRKMTVEQVQAYVDSGEWIDKAGAYAIQMTADRYVKHIEGSFTNVVGLPMELVLRMLAQARFAY